MRRGFAPAPPMQIAQAPLGVGNKESGCAARLFLRGGGRTPAAPVLPPPRVPTLLSPAPISPLRGGDRRLSRAGDAYGSGAACGAGGSNAALTCRPRHGRLSPVAPPLRRGRMGAGKGGGGDLRGGGGKRRRWGLPPPPATNSRCGAAAFLISQAERRLSDLGVRGRSPCVCISFAERGQQGAMGG
jgi:hypothetical protein